MLPVKDPEIDSPFFKHSSVFMGEMSQVFSISFKTKGRGGGKQMGV